VSREKRREAYPDQTETIITTDERDRRGGGGVLSPAIYTAISSVIRFRLATISDVPGDSCVPCSRIIQRTGRAPSERARASTHYRFLGIISIVLLGRAARAISSVYQRKLSNQCATLLARYSPQIALDRIERGCRSLFSLSLSLPVPTCVPSDVHGSLSDRVLVCNNVAPA